MSFIAKLFRRSAGEGAPPAPTAAAVTSETEYRGFTIRARPFKEQGQFQTAGEIEKLVDGAPRVHRFIRADRTPSIEEATELALSKARLMVDQQGDGLFGPV